MKDSKEQGVFPVFLIVGYNFFKHYSEEIKLANKKTGIYPDITA